MKVITLKLYKTFHQLMPIACVDLVIKSDYGILLGKRRNKPAQGKWWFMGGRVLKGETLN